MKNNKMNKDYKCFFFLRKYTELKIFLLLKCFILALEDAPVHYKRFFRLTIVALLLDYSVSLMTAKLILILFLTVFFSIFYER